MRDVNNREILVEHIAGINNLADILTKPLGDKKFKNIFNAICSGGESENCEEVHLADANMDMKTFIIVFMLVEFQ